MKICGVRGERGDVRGRPGRWIAGVPGELGPTAEVQKLVERSEATRSEGKAHRSPGWRLNWGGRAIVGHRSRSDLGL